jgi:hypothetical protein
MTLARQNENKTAEQTTNTESAFDYIPKKLVFKTSLIKNTLAGTQYLRILQKNSPILVMITGSGSKIEMKNF